MSLASCSKCWDTPCVCGWDYRHLDVEQRIKQAATILGIDSSDLADRLKGFTPKPQPAE